MVMAMATWSSTQREQEGKQGELKEMDSVMALLRLS
jgi:hypothetical protein